MYLSEKLACYEPAEYKSQRYLSDMCCLLFSIITSIIQFSICQKWFKTLFFFIWKLDTSLYIFSYQLCKKYYYKQQQNCLQLSFVTRSLFLIRLLETVCSSLDMFLTRFLPTLNNFLNYSIFYSILFYWVYYILLGISWKWDIKQINFAK